MTAAGREGRGELYVVLPLGVDDPAFPSGGNTYDLRACEGLGAAGWHVSRILVGGAWPRAGSAGREELAAALTQVPDGTVVLLDGLVACAAPEIVVPQSDRLRLVVLVHLPLADETGLAPLDAADLDARERRSVRAAAAVVATSEATASNLRARHGLSAAVVHVAPPGTDPAPPAEGTDGGTRLLCVAAVTPRKGHDLLVEALATLADLDWTCVCAGPLDRSPRFVEQVRTALGAHDLRERVLLTGPRTGGDLAAVYGATDLLVLPSRAEPFGMVVIEALARGVPVVAAAVDGVPEALGIAAAGDIAGMLVRPEDPTALADALRRWLTDPGLRRRLRAAAARRRSTLSGWDRTTAQLDAVLAGLGEAS